MFHQENCAKLTNFYDYQCLFTITWKTFFDSIADGNIMPEPRHEKLNSQMKKTIPIPRAIQHLLSPGGKIVKVVDNKSNQ